jgi:hypothetical protein
MLFSSCYGNADYAYIVANHPVAAPIVLLPQPSPSSTTITPPMPQCSLRHCHNSHHAVASIVPLPFYYYSTTLAMLVPSPSPYCGYHDPHHAVATTLSVMLPYSHHLTVALLQQSQPPFDFSDLICVVSAPHCCHTYHTILLPHLYPVSCHKFKQCFLICCRNPHCCCHELLHHFEGASPFFPRAHCPACLPFYGQFLTLLLLMVMK